MACFETVADSDRGPFAPVDGTSDSGRSDPRACAPRVSSSSAPWKNYTGGLSWQATLASSQTAASPARG
eukprot:9623315-Lingulodinium_polyedra.AAC.1